MRKIKLLSRCLAGIVSGEINRDLLSLFRIQLALEIAFPQTSLARLFKFECNDDDTATLILKRIGYRVEFRLNRINFLIDICDVAFDFVQRPFRVFIELLIFRRSFYFFFGFAGVFADAAEIGGVALDEFALDRSPRALAETFVNYVGGGVTPWHVLATLVAGYAVVAALYGGPLGIVIACLILVEGVDFEKRFHANK